jgi:serine/threonine protein kinase/formylglycine-generating enzyme required for sulfatase activity
MSDRNDMHRADTMQSGPDDPGGGGQQQGGYVPGKTVAEGAGFQQVSTVPDAGGGGAKTIAEGGAAPSSGPSDHTRLVGRTIDRYKIDRLLGEGGFGAVYLAKHTLMKRDVAFKTLHRDMASDPMTLHRFLKEGQVSSRVQHKHLIEIYDFGPMDDGSYFMAMEFLPGDDLRDTIKKRGALEVGETFDIMIQTLAGLQAAHDSGVIHRDLKPDNIKLEEREERENFVKILDFGIAKIVEQHDDADDLVKGMSEKEIKNALATKDKGEPMAASDQFKTQAGAFFGTPEYGSPEQCAGESIDSRSDIYTMGCILYECLTGQLPYVSKTPQGFLAQHMVADPRPIKEVMPEIEIPPQLQEILNKALEKDRDERYQTAREFADDLIECARANKIPITVEPEFQEATPLWKILVATVVPMLAIAGLLYYALGENPELKAARDAFTTAMNKTFLYDQVVADFRSEQKKTLRNDFRDSFFGDDAKPGWIPQLETKIESRNQRIEGVYDGVVGKFEGAGLDTRVYQPHVRTLESEIANPETQAAPEDVRGKLSGLRDQIERSRAPDADTYSEQVLADAEKEATNLKYGKRERYDEAVKLIARKWRTEYQGTPADGIVAAKKKEYESARDNISVDDLAADKRLKDWNDFFAASPGEWTTYLLELQKLYRDEKLGRTDAAQAAKKLEKEMIDGKYAELEASVTARLEENSADSIGKALTSVRDFPRNVLNSDPGQAVAQQLTTLEQRVMDHAGATWSATFQQAEEDRYAGMVEQAASAVEPWTRFIDLSIFGARSQRGTPVRYMQTLNIIRPLHLADADSADQMMVRVPGSENVIIGEEARGTSFPPQPPRKMSAFFVDRFEVSNLWYKRFVDDTEPARRDGLLPSSWERSWLNNGLPREVEDHPVRGVSFEQAGQFARWAGKRIPTEFEWEYAARGPETQKLPWTDEWPALKDVPELGQFQPAPGTIPTAQVNEYESVAFQHWLAPQNGKNAVLFNMAGNVAEWTASPYIPYTSVGDRAPRDDPDYSSKRRVIRGGSFAANGLILACRTSARYHALQLVQRDDVGFRCAKSASQGN